MKSFKYFATAIALLMIFSSLPLVSYASTPGVLSGSQVALHGPLVNAIKFTVIGSDSTLFSSLASGTIQGPEWYFSTGSFFQAATNKNLYANSTTTYSFYGFAFNMVRPVTNDTHFRLAIQDLQDYGTLQSTVLSGVAGSAAPDLYPCVVYPTVCDPSLYAGFTFSQSAAVAQLKLVHNDVPAFTWTNSSDALSSYKWFYNGVQWSPNLWYRIDDPLRTQAALRLVYNAQGIGLTINAQGTAHASGVVYHPSLSAVISPGAYNPSTGYNSPPVFNYSLAETTDTWDMYTFGWITSPNYIWAYSFFNSQFVTVTLNYDNFYNRSMDYYTNQMNYATTLAAASSAAKSVGQVFSQQLPYVMLFYTNQLYAVYLNGWAGYVNYASTGPMTSYGMYYSSLNLHPAGQATGGTFTYAVHAVSDATGMDPLYNTNWVWQADLWSNIYDSALAFNPMAPTTALSFVPWEGAYTVASFNGKTGSGAGWFDFQTAKNALSPQNIVSGQEITFNLYKNMTFFDNTPVTANDFNYSLWVNNVAGALPDNYAPLYGYTLAGPTGLIATYVPPSNPYQLQIYVNSSSVWNIANVGVPIFPQHIFKYFNADLVSGGTAALDTTLTFANAASGCSCLATGVTTTNAPLWLRDEYNLEVSNGPFWLKSFDPTTGSGEMDKNVNYYRAAWYAGAPSASAGSTYTFSTTIAENIFNSGSSTLAGVSAGQTGSAPITNATGTVTLYLNNAKVGTPVPLTAGSNGQYTAAINTAGLTSGLYELVVNATYSFLGLPRIWYQAAGLQVTGAVTTTTTSTTSTSTSTTSTTTSTTSTTTSTTSTSTTTTSTSTSSSVDYTPYIIGGVVVVIIIIIAVALATRRRRGGT
jgi:hypothetical protein